MMTLASLYNLEKRRGGGIYLGGMSVQDVDSRRIGLEFFYRLGNRQSSGKGY